MKKLNSPDFLNDLYRDLRDRRLLLPIAGLLVAIIAVPILLRGGSEPAPPPSAAAPASDLAAEVQPAVLAEQVGVRNYRKRLAALKEKNPFVQKFSAPNPEDVALEAVGGDSISADSGASVGGSTDTTITDTTATSTGGSTGLSETTQTTETTETTQTTTEPSGGSSAGEDKPAVRFYSGRVDVTVGPLGDAKDIDDVRPLDFLPNDKLPIVAFINLKTAGSVLFALSSEVTETSGDGTCAPKESDGCQYLTLKIGEQRTLKLTDGKTYRLKLRDVHVVRVPDPRKAVEASGENK
jgi:hypothetical protein